VADALSIENHQISYESSLYESHYDDYLKTIRNASNDKKSTMIIGHNPVIHGLAVQIAKDDGNKFYNRLMCLYPPASLSVFDLPIEKWSDLKLSDNTLVDFRTV
jgi:phosphohistidine phosphatase